MQIKHLNDGNTNELLRNKTICQTSMDSSRASSVKQCSKNSQLLNESGSTRKNAYERDIFNFTCKVSRFYGTHFSKVFHKTIRAVFSRAINIG